MFISKRNLSLLALFVFVLQLFAQGPNNTLVMMVSTNAISRLTSVLTEQCGICILAQQNSSSPTQVAIMAWRVVCITVSTPFRRVGLVRLHL